MRNLDASPQRKQGQPPAACTIISRNYLTFARILVKSYARHQAGGRFYLFVVDGLPDGEDAGADAHVLGPEDLDLPRFHEMCFEYDVAELCTAMKPSLLLALFDRFGEEEVVFFDPDILIMRPLDEIRKQLPSVNIVLTPHILKPIPSDGLRPGEQDFLLAGAYNLGFLALRRSEETRQFLRWWEEHLQDGGAVVDVPKGLMTDQKWMDLVPSLFPSTALLRDDTYNVAWWNLHHRVLSRRGEQFLVNGRPLTFFHFSGFDPSRPRLFTKEHQTRTKVVEGSPLEELLDLYADLHVQNGYRKIREWRYRYSHFDNGVLVNLILRRLYLDLDAATRERFGDPFRVAKADSFFDWAIRPQPAEANLSPFLRSLYLSRSDLWPAFPDIRGADRAAFLEWAETHGAREMKYDPKAMRISERKKKKPHVAPRAPRPYSNGIPPKHVRHYQQVIHTIGETARTALPPAATMLVISKGDDELLALLERDGRKARHFPQNEEGVWAGYNPADSAEAIAHLEDQRAKGANFLLLPASTRWWLDHYGAFRQHLEKHYHKVLDREEACLIFALDQSEST